MKMLRVFTTVVAVLMVGGMVLNAQTTTLLTLEDALKKFVTIKKAYLEKLVLQLQMVVYLVVQKQLSLMMKN